MFDPVSYLPAVAVLGLAIFTTYLIALKLGAPSKAGRYVAIDGLRGYLALLVFLHHSCIWYFYLHTGTWAVPPSHLYTHFGQSSVAFFFMITGYLFFSKLIDGKTKRIDWTSMFVSRALRLTPLYLFAVLLLFSIVVALSKGTLHQNGFLLARDAMRWLTFTILGAPDLNGVVDTSTIIASVTWSLPYEWLFYLSLPVLALVIGNAAPPAPFLMFGLAGIIGFATKYFVTPHLLSFAGGILAAVLMRFEWFRAVAPKRIYSLVVLLCLGLTILLFPSAYGIAPLVLLSLAFSLIAGGNTVFGLLSNAVSRTLGQATYSIYLLHGLVLFTVIHFVVGADVVRTFSPLHYWGMICVVTPMLVLISFATFRFIEHPAMQSAATATAWLRSIMMRSSLTRSRLADLPANHAQHQRREYAANQLESALEQQRRDQS